MSEKLSGMKNSFQKIDKFVCNQLDVGISLVNSKHFMNEK